MSNKAIVTTLKCLDKLGIFLLKRQQQLNKDEISEKWAYEQSLSNIETAKHAIYDSLLEINQCHQKEHYVLDEDTIERHIF